MYVIEFLIFFLYQIKFIYTDFQFSEITIGIIDISKKIDPLASYEINQINKPIKQSPFYFSTTQPLTNLFYPKKNYHAWNNYVPLYKKKQVPYEPRPSKKIFQSFKFNKVIPKSKYKINQNYQKSGKCNEKIFYQSDPNDCRKYTVCAGGRLITMSCPKFLVFDQTLKSCNYSKYVNGQCSTNRFFY